MFVIVDFNSKYGATFEKSDSMNTFLTYSKFNSKNTFFSTTPQSNLKQRGKIRFLYSENGKIRKKQLRNTISKMLIFTSFYK